MIVWKSVTTLLSKIKDQLERKISKVQIKWPKIRNANQFNFSMLGVASGACQRVGYQGWGQW